MGVGVILKGFLENVAPKLKTKGEINQAKWNGKGSREEAPLFAMYSW